MGTTANRKTAIQLGCLTIRAPIDDLHLIASATGLVEILWKERAVPVEALRVRPGDERFPVLGMAAEQLAEYFAGTRASFHIPLDLRGTAFQLRVWEQLQNIPYGETCSYLDIARRLGDEKATRAVGAANGRNPIPVVIPCHRVIGTNGSLTGFGGGIQRKQLLLELEGHPRRLFI